jgi:hypothetical protein
VGLAADDAQALGEGEEGLESGNVNRVEALDPKPHRHQNDDWMPRQFGRVWFRD